MSKGNCVCKFVRQINVLRCSSAYSVARPTAACDQSALNVFKRTLVLRGCEPRPPGALKNGAPCIALDIFGGTGQSRLQNGELARATAAQILEQASAQTHL